MANRRRRKNSNSGINATVIIVAVICFILLAGIVGTGQDSSNTASPSATSSSSSSSSSAPSSSSSTSQGSEPAPSSSAPAASTALSELDALSVAGLSSRSGYDRDQFGSAWQDVDNNGCDTRNDILARDLTSVVRESNNCTVLSGTLSDPYTNTTINFVRGRATSSAVQIDHKIPLALAWTQGASSWDEAKREAFANDPENLIAVDGPTNGSKSDSSSDEWLPPNKAYWCVYAADQVKVKTKYALSITQNEKNTLQDILSGC